MSNRVAAALLLFIGMASDLAFAAKASSCGNEASLCRDSRMAAEILNVLDPTEQLFVAAGASDPTRAVTVAANELMWQSNRDKPGVGDEARAIAAQRLVDSYLRVGLSEDAIKLYESLDATTRERLVHGPVVFGDAEISQLSSFFLDQDPALTAASLAAAYAETGHRNEADALAALASNPVPIEGDHSGMHGAGHQIAGQCVRALIHADTQTDWFSWVFGDERQAHKFIGCPLAVESRAYTRLAAKGQSLSELPETWRTGVEPNGRPDVTSGSKDELAAALKKLPKVRARIDELKHILAAIDQKDARWIALQQQHENTERFGSTPAKVDEPSQSDRALAKVLAERLARPVFNPYRIVESPPLQNNKKPEKGVTCAHGAIRCLDVAQLRWELLMSKDYDPSGEVPVAGYWLRRTELPNGQPQWFYLGIKEHMPFELVESDEPFIMGDELRLLVRRAAIDPAKIVFPPIGLDIRGDKKVFELRASLVGIMKDSDADGLTDLAEQQLLLDPRKADSDGDGIQDGQDPLPNVALTKVTTSRQSAFAAAIGFLTNEPDLAISAFVPGSDIFVRRRSGDERTLFVITDPENLAGTSAGHRIIVLPNSLDMALLHKHPAFGVFFPMHVSLRMLDETHAELTYDASWQGGTLAMELHKGVWRIGTLSGWIT